MVLDAKAKDRTAAPLVYPFDQEPQTGDGNAIEVAPGVSGLRMPLFARLQWINVWALADGDGWATGESIAHLNHLQTTGRATAAIDADGVKWWHSESV